jgi:nucleotide-binding universal stress UspA family protein
MKNVLVLIHDDPGQESRLQVALDVTRALDGHLRCLDVSIVPETVTDYVDMGGGALPLNDEEASERRNRARTETRLQAEDVRFDWVDCTGDLARSLADASALADLVVINRELPDIRFPDMLLLADDLLGTIDKPILAVPREARGLNVFGRALVAWDGSADAEDALQAATPLLANAASVTLLYADDGSIGVPVEDAARYLARHGVPTLVDASQDVMRRPADTILEAASFTRADYVVMGAYGHSRLRETLFGGVTKRMLHECPVPVFLKHHR